MISVPYCPTFVFLNLTFLMYSRPTAENNPAGKQRNLDNSFSNLSVKKTKKTKHL